MNNESNAFGAFIFLVNDMRRLQKEYFELATGKGAHNNRHALTRCLQCAKSAEKKVDMWLQAYALEQGLLRNYRQSVKGSEIQAEYNFSDEAKTG